MFYMNGEQLCAQTDRDIFFPVSKADPNKKLAIAMCNRCPLLSACDAYAEKTPGLYGIWGGKEYYGTGFVSAMSHQAGRKLSA
jgi:hypothetical protein